MIHLTEPHHRFTERRFIGPGLDGGAATISADAAAPHSLLPATDGPHDQAIIEQITPAIAKSQADFSALT